MGVRGATTRPATATKAAAMLPASPSPRARLRPPQGLFATAQTAPVHADRPSASLVTRRSVDEDPVLKVAFRAYPFPPPRTPLSYPLRPSRTTESTALAKGSSAALGLRKRILHRWKDEARKSASSHPQRLMAAEAESFRSQRVTASSNAPPSRSTARKRARSPLLPEAHVEASPPFDLVPGDPVLSQPRGHATSSKPAFATEHRSRYSFQTESSDPRPAKIPRRESKTDFDRMPTVRLANADSPHPLISFDDPREEFVHTVNDFDNNITSKKSHPKPYNESHQERVRLLKLQRRALEEAELDEVTRVAELLGSDTITTEERNHLKDDLESLSRKGVRDCLRLVSRRMAVTQPGQRIEVKLHLDILPADLLRELQLVVMKEKGQLNIPASAQLTEVRSELKQLTRIR